MYNGQSDAGASVFTWFDQHTGQHTFEFNLQYYNPSEGEPPNRLNSGAYYFVPELEDQVTHLYSEFSSIEVHQGQLASEFALVYSDANKEAVY